MAKKKYFLLIPKDKDNVDAEQFKVYQKDGETVRVAIGVQQEVPQWVAERAVVAGDVENYIVTD